MRFPLLLATGLSLATPLSAAVKSGHAEADLISGVTSYQAGKTFPVAIRLKIEPGWHTYWINPGIGGMPLKATWTLPEGWTAGDLKQPVPKRFMTGELPGFGYEGEALFLVDLTPPDGATAEAECKVKLAWLTCDDSACVPGDAELLVTLAAGDGKPGEEAPLIEAASKKIPVPPEQDLGFGIEERDGKLILFVIARSEIDLAGVSAFPATPDVIDPAEPLTFENGKDAWMARGRKSEYLKGPATQLDIVVAGGKLKQPLLLSWRAEE